MEQTRENKMGVMPVNRLLITMSLPMMASMLVQALYNIVDSIFVSRINENALTAVSLAFPIQTLMVAVGVGTCVGINAVLSKALGEKDQETVNKTAGNGMILMAVSYLVFLLIGIFVTRIFYLSQTEDAQIVQYGCEYLSVVCCMSFGMFTQFTFERLLQSTGKTFYIMITQGIGAVINIILDPIFIFGLLGMPKMGVRGAAVATVIGQITAGILAFVINKKKNDEIQVTGQALRPDPEIIRQIYKIGVPSIFKLQSFIFMPVFGMNNGLVPILAYNYGAGKKDRFIDSLKCGIKYAIGIMFVGLVIFQTVPGMLLRLFDASEDMLAIGIPALRTISYSFVFAGFGIVCGTAFQALGSATYSMMVSIARQLVVLLPAAYLLALTGDVNNVWWAFPIAEIMSLLMTIIFMTRINKQVISHIGEDK